MDFSGFSRCLGIVQMLSFARFGTSVAITSTADGARVAEMCMCTDFPAVNGCEGLQKGLKGKAGLERLEQPHCVLTKSSPDSLPTQIWEIWAGRNGSMA